MLKRFYRISTTRFLRAGYGVLAYGMLAQASVIYNNGAPGRANPVIANNISYFVGAEDFTLPSTETLTGAHVWLYGNSGYAGSIAWTLYANSGSNAPGTLMDSGNSGAAFTPTGFVWSDGTPEYEMTFSFAPFTATASTAYWLGIRNAVPNPQNSPASIPPFDWELTGPNGTLTSYFYGYGCCGAPTGWHPFNYSDTGLSQGGEHAFELLGTSTTPEPATYAMFGLGVVGLCLWGRRVSG